MSGIPGDTLNNHHPTGQYTILIVVAAIFTVTAIVTIFFKFCVDKERNGMTGRRQRRTTGGAADSGFAMGAMFSGGADCGGFSGGGDCGGFGGDCGGF
ncbi:hypothetical protein CAEBREN_12461 [Caenorhabditis brenneri]|uniref:Uncharacterized protein n=1 Tax=Caenorhabditis brenneri TaxID=135651 RepID=G0MJQ5_CAEBE|nr:hypothetical protein CAEBREN_12461 [Caenorhabditis brenneri]